MMIVSFIFFCDWPLSTIVVDTAHVVFCTRPVLILVDMDFVQHWKKHQIPRHVMWDTYSDTIQL